MSTTYNTGTDNWTYNHKRPDGHRLLGPCPHDGVRTYDYGGGWACLNPQCKASPEQVVCNNGPQPTWWDTDVVVNRDGSAWCASGAGFENIQESPCGFGDTPAQAVSAHFAAAGIA